MTGLLDFLQEGPMVTCPQCHASTAGGVGAALSCSNCLARFTSDGPLPWRSPPPAVPLGLKLSSLVAYVTPFAAAVAFLALGEDSELASRVVPTVAAATVFGLGILSGALSRVLLKRFETRWRSVAGGGLAFSFVGFPLLCGALLGLLFLSGAFAFHMP